MAKKKKKRSNHPAPRHFQKEAASWPWIALTAALLGLVAAMVLFGLLRGKQPTNTPDTTGASTTAPSDIPGVTAPVVDDSKTTTMRIVKPGSAYVEKDKNAGTVFSFRKGDLVEMVEQDGQWVTIAVEGRGYYLPREMVRGENEYLIVIDAGHHRNGDHGKEAIGPGGAATETKMDVGYTGVYTNQNEYELNLAVARKLRDVLQSRGYKVAMTHNGGDCTSYMERANVANQSYADAYISLHAGSSTDPEIRGVSAICQTKENPYVAELYTESKDLCQQIVDAVAQTTSAKKLDLQETDKMSGINWCQVPVAYVEMGYLSNANEDRLLSTDEYQQKIAEGIANGLDKFFADEEKK